MDIAQRPKTKIVATLGPKSRDLDTIKRMISAGMTVARLNWSHDTLEAHGEAFDRVRSASKELGIPVGIMVDVPGPKYRTGDQKDRTITLVEGAEIRLTGEEVAEGSAERLSVHPNEPEGIREYAQVGDTILVDDGMIALRAKAIDGADMVCEVVMGGEMTANRGVSIRWRTPKIYPLTERSKAALAFAADKGADFVALSNVKEAENVTYVRNFLRNEYNGYEPFIITKIETWEAAVKDNGKVFDDILDKSDGIMVARGDLGVSIELEDVPIEQKKMIAKCNHMGVPVITATQMLQSMQDAPMPTRAEATDVSNAVEEGTDALMLSGETAMGADPELATRTMSNLAMKREGELDARRKREATDRAGRIQATLDYFRMFEDESGSIPGEPRVDDEVSYRAAQLGNTLNALGLVAFTETGGTARRVSRYKPIARILALTPHKKTQLTLTVSWGVIPVLVGKINNDEDLRDEAKFRAVETGMVRKEDGGKIVLTYGTPFGQEGGTNGVQVLAIEENEKLKSPSMESESANEPSGESPRG